MCLLTLQKLYCWTLHGRCSSQVFQTLHYLNLAWGLPIDTRFDDLDLRKNNSKKAYQLVKDLTTVKQGKANTVQDRSGKCLTEERQILNRWTEYCSELYNYKANGDPSVLNCTQTDTEDDHPILRQKWRPQYNH